MKHFPAVFRADFATAIQQRSRRCKDVVSYPMPHFEWRASANELRRQQIAQSRQVVRSEIEQSMRANLGNPYSESQFKTMKYRPDFPARFGSLADARAHCQTFFAWYNTEHRHSGIGYMTPSSVHCGEAHAARALRQDTLDTAFMANPKRFKGRRPAPPELPTAVWINPPATGKTDDSSTPASTVNS